MRNCAFVMLVLAALGIGSVAHAGWLDNAIENAAERLGHRAVNEAGDTAYDGAKRGVKKSVREAGNGEDQAASHQQARKKKGADGGDVVASEDIYSKYDFIPGDRVIFFDDFSDSDLGEFPRKWTLAGPKNGNNNAVEVVELKGKRFLRSVPAQEDGGQGGSTQYVRLNTNGDLPQKFTIEFDAVLGNRNDNDVIQYFLLMTHGEEFPVSAVADTGSIQITSEKGQSKNTETSLKMKDGKVHHLAFSVNGTFVKGYVDNVRVVNDPDAIERPVRRIGIYMGPYSGTRMSNVMFTNFRLAEGGKSIKSALDTDGKIVTHGILFDTGSDKIKPESLPTLKSILALLEQDPDLSFSIEGHTDNQGGKGVNQPLSEKRSAAVMRWLKGKGISADRLRSKGWGESKPIDTNSTVEGRANNRRVEFIKM